MKVYLVTHLIDKSQGESLTRKRAQKRLISFWYIRDKKEELRNYIATGIWKFTYQPQPQETKVSEKLVFFLFLEDSSPIFL